MKSLTQPIFILAFLFILDSILCAYPSLASKYTSNASTKLQNQYIKSLPKSGGSSYSPYQKSRDKRSRASPYREEMSPADYRDVYETDHYPRPISYPKQDPHHQPRINEDPNDWEKLWDGPTGECTSNSTAPEECPRLHGSREGLGRWICNGSDLTCFWFSYEYSEDEEDSIREKSAGQKSGSGNSKKVDDYIKHHQYGAPLDPSKRRESERGYSKERGQGGEKKNRFEFEPVIVKKATSIGCSSNNDCDSDSFCEIIDIGVCPSQSNDSTVRGTCKKRPERCQSAFIKPVCGCDGKTYQNGCLAQQAGVNLLDLSPCN